MPGSGERGQGSSMTTDWAVDTATERIEADPAGNASITFTVSNPGPVQDRAVLDIVTSEKADAHWFTGEQPQRLVTPQSTVNYTVALAAPAGTPPGQYWIQ